MNRIILRVGYIFVAISLVCVVSWEIWRKEIVRKIAHANRTQFEIILDIAAESNYALFLGLPHRALEPDLYRNEKATKDTTTFRGYEFYTGSAKISEWPISTGIYVETLKSSNYSPYSGPKDCEFHPDYLYFTRNDKHSVELFLSFSSREVLVYLDEKKYLYDINYKRSKFFRHVLLVADERNCRPMSEGSDYLLPY